MKEVCNLENIYTCEVYMQPALHLLCIGCCLRLKIHELILIRLFFHARNQNILICFCAVRWRLAATMRARYNYTLAHLHNAGLEWERRVLLALFHPCGVCLLFQAQRNTLYTRLY